MGNIETKQERIIQKCMKKGYIVYRIQNKLIIEKNNNKTEILFEGRSYEEIIKKMIKYLKEILKE